MMFLFMSDNIQKSDNSKDRYWCNLRIVDFAPPIIFTQQYYCYCIHTRVILSFSAQNLDMPNQRSHHEWTFIPAKQNKYERGISSYVTMIFPFLRICLWVAFVCLGVGITISWLNIYTITDIGSAKNFF